MVLLALSMGRLAPPRRARQFHEAGSLHDRAPPTKQTPQNTRQNSIAAYFRRTQRREADMAVAGLHYGKAGSSRAAGN